MAKKTTSKKTTDLNSLAHSIVGKVTSSNDNRDKIKEKNPAAVALGRLGGLKGGKKRAEKLSADERSKIASDAAKARWNK